jgi:hypothetical protein
LNHRAMKKLHTKSKTGEILSLIFSLALLSLSQAQAAPLPGNLLVTTFNYTSPTYIREYSTNAVLAATYLVPNVGEQARDLVVDGLGGIHIYNGTFAPKLSSLNPQNNTWTERTFPGWSSVGNLSYGGIATFENYVFAGDMTTYGAEASGIIRFDLANNTAQRFADGGQFIDLTAGWDGLLYGLLPYISSEGTRVYVYHPSTMEFIRYFDLAVGLRGISVDANGHVFGVDWSGYIHHLNANGQIIKSVFSGTTGLSDIDLTPDGQIAIGSRISNLIMTDRSLNSITTHNLGFYYNIFVAFVQPPPSPRPDNFPPVANAGPDQVLSANSSCQQTVALNGSASTDPDGDALTYVWSGSFGIASGSQANITLGVGTHVLTLTVQDPSGATSSDTVTIRINDVTPPALSVPESFSVNTAPGQAGANVSFTDLLAAADGCGSVQLSSTPASGSFFPVGQTVVTVTATDAAGNQTQASFTITVADAEAPVATYSKVPVGGAGKKIQYGFRVAATDNVTASPQIFIKDSASSYIAGPFQTGDILKFTQHAKKAPGTFPADAPVTATVQLKGNPLVFAIDSVGNTSAAVPIQ